MDSAPEVTLLPSTAVVEVLSKFVVGTSHQVTLPPCLNRYCPDSDKFDAVWPWSEPMYL